MRAPRGLRHLVAGVLVLLCPVLAEGQGRRLTELAVAGFPLAITETTVADYDAGAVALGSTTFTVDLTRNAGGGGFSPRQTTVNVRCASPCPTSGTLDGSALQWRLLSSGSFVPLTTAFALVESRVAAFNGANDPWSNSIVWQYALDWATATPTAVDAVFTIEFELVVTAP